MTISSMNPQRARQEVQNIERMVSRSRLFDGNIISTIGSMHAGLFRSVVSSMVMDHIRIDDSMRHIMTGCLDIGARMASMSAQEEMRWLRAMMKNEHRSTAHQQAAAHLGCAFDLMSSSQWHIMECHSMDDMHPSDCHDDMRTILDRDDSVILHVYFAQERTYASMFYHGRADGTSSAYGPYVTETVFGKMGAPMPCISVHRLRPKTVTMCLFQPDADGDSALQVSHMSGNGISGTISSYLAHGILDGACMGGVPNPRGIGALLMLLRSLQSDPESRDSQA
jgi:hypothetical protein